MASKHLKVVTVGSETCVVRKFLKKNDFKQILAKVYTSTFPGSNFNTAYRIEYVA